MVNAMIISSPAAAPTFSDHTAQCLRIGVQEDIFVFLDKKSSVRLSKATQCPIIRVQEDIFVFLHKKSSVRLGKATQCLSIGVQEDIYVFIHKKIQLG